MPAVKSSRAKKALRSVGKKNWWNVVTVGVIVTGVVGGVGFYAIDNLVIPKAKNQAIQEMKGQGSLVYITTKDLKQGDPLLGAVELVGGPNYLVPSNAKGSDNDISNLVATTDLPTNTMVTNINSYDPYKQDGILDSSRDVIIKYLPIENLEDGEYIDIRIKIFSDDGTVPFSDEVVVAKKKVSKLPDGSGMVLVLTEGEILNLNDAVVLAANNIDKVHAELYTTRYVSPNVQDKASVTYMGRGHDLTISEVNMAIDKLEQALREQQSGNTIEDSTVDEVQDAADINEVSGEQNNSLTEGAETEVQDTANNADIEEQNNSLTEGAEAEVQDTDDNADIEEKNNSLTEGAEAENETVEEKVAN